MLMADMRILNNKAVIAEIIKALNLPRLKTTLSNDSHYRPMFEQ